MIARLLGAVIGGGGAFAALHFGSLGLPQAAVIGIAAAMAVAGAAFGPKVWEAIIHLV